MNVNEIRTAVSADPELLALAQARDTVEIAARLSVGRKRIGPLRMTEPDIMSALGVEAGEAFLVALETFTGKTLAGNHPLKNAQPGIKRVLKWLAMSGQGGGLNVGDPLTRQLLDVLASVGEVNAGSVATIKARAEQPDPVPESAVIAAIFNQDGSLRV